MITEFKKLDKLYSDFFKELNIDNISGIVNGTNKRFATKVGIGENYFSAKKKILFISLDIGKDEYFSENRYQNYQERRENALYYSVEGRNPHMAGVYGVAIYFLKDYFGWEDCWKTIESSKLYFRETLLQNKDTIPNNVLSNIALINFYNFVTIGRSERTGSDDRVFIDKIKELALLSEIINELKPDVIVVQSKSLKTYFKNNIKQKLNYNPDIFISFHPSVFGRGIKYRNPKLHIDEMLLSGKL